MLNPSERATSCGAILMRWGEMTSTAASPRASCSLPAGLRVPAELQECTPDHPLVQKSASPGQK